MSSLFTCITCHVAFATPEAQREHYKTDWHRYNLKRKVAELPPVSAESFQERVTTYKIGAIESSQPQPSLYCATCRKKFSSTNAYNNHIQSKKHMEIMNKSEGIQTDVSLMNKKNTEMSQVEDGGIKKNQKGEITIKKDMAAGTSSSMKGKQPIVSRKAGSDDEWEDVDGDEVLDDVEGEESWEDVEEEPILPNTCLFCSKESQNLDENVAHMTTEHSFFIPDLEFLVDLEGLITYLGEKVGVGNVCLWCNEKGRSFYSIRAVQNHMQDKGHCKILHEGQNLVEFADFYDYSSSYPDAEATEAQAPNPDDEIAENMLDTADYELVLPSGSVIGHRSLMKYYRQRLPAEKQVVKSGKSIKRLLCTYKALGWTGTTGEAAVRHARDINYMRKIQLKHHMKLGVKANKLQHHYRPQVDF